MTKSNKDHRCGITSSFDIFVRWFHFWDSHTALLKRTSLLLGNYPSPGSKEYPRNKAILCLQCSKFNFTCDSHAALSEQTSLLLGNYSSPAHTRRSLFWGWVEGTSKEQGCYVSAILQVQFLNCQLIVRPKIL